MKESKNWIIGETLGTFLLVLFGCGSVATAVAFGAQIGLFQVAIVWGFGLTLAITLTAPLSGAHLNPAITLAMAMNKRIGWSRVPGYILFQFIGAILAAGLIYLVFGGGIERFELVNGIERGQPGSEASAMIFGEFYPNPSGKPISETDSQLITGSHAFLAELFGTALLALVIFGITDGRRKLPDHLIPFIIGITLTTLISLFAPVSMAGFNPARDLGPRLFSSLVGWGDLPFAVNGMGWLTVYIIAPILGALLGGSIYNLCLKNRYKG